METSNLVIWKFEFKVARECELMLPRDYRIIHVGSQRLTTITIWAIVDPEAEKVPVKFYVRGTGHKLDEALPGNHIETVMDAPYVWHVFKG